MKKIIDEHGRVFGKVSIIDFLVVLIAIVLGVALYVKYNVLEVTSVAGKTDTFSYTITIYGAREYAVDGLQIGDALYDKNGSGGNTVGSITDKKVTDATKASELLDGTVVMGKYEGRYDITLTITANGAVSGGRYLVNKTYEVNTNSIRNFYTKYCAFEATISEIS
jgi:hypothetical protein